MRGHRREEGNWLFWDARGHPLQPKFITPNKRGLISVQSGKYQLARAEEPHHVLLLTALNHIVAVDGPPTLNSIEAVRQHLEAISHGRADGP